MRQLLDPAYWRAVARNPTALIGLAADLSPLVAILAWGWGAPALIVLYWLENVLIGAFVLLRVLVRNVGQNGPVGMLGTVLGTPFFIIHYGGFCFVHGMLLLGLFQDLGTWPHHLELADTVGWLLGQAIMFAPHMNWMLGLLIAAHGAVFLRDYVLRGGWRNTTSDQEMNAPYGRVIVLHLGLLALSWALFVLGDPAIGAVLLVLARAAWGLNANMKQARRAQPTPTLAAA